MESISPNQDILVERIEKCITLTNGIELDLSDCDLSDVPQKVLELAYSDHICSLSLRNNQLTNLPASFVESFSSLKRLNLSSNQLENLPHNFGQLKALEKCYLQDNQLTKLPESMYRLTKLKELYLQHNRLCTLDSSMSNCQALEKLHLAHNNIEHIPAEFEKCTALVIVDLTGNTIAFAPERFRRLHDYHSILHSKERRRELIQRALKVRHSVTKMLQRHQNPALPLSTTTYLESTSVEKK